MNNHGIGPSMKVSIHSPENFHKGIAEGLDISPETAQSLIDRLVEPTKAWHLPMMNQVLLQLDLSAFPDFVEFNQKHKTLPLSEGKKVETRTASIIDVFPDDYVCECGEQHKRVYLCLFYRIKYKETKAFFSLKLQLMEPQDFVLLSMIDTFGGFAITQQDTASRLNELIQRHGGFYMDELVSDGVFMGMPTGVLPSIMETSAELMQKMANPSRQN